MDRDYWANRSAALLRQYRALQGLADVAKNEGTPEMVEATASAMAAVWRLVGETDHQTNQEARHEMAESGPLPCDHEWQGNDGGNDYRCRWCGAWWSYDGNLTAEEPPFAQQEAAYERYDHALSGCADPVHERQRRITLGRAAHADYSGRRLFVASPLDSLFS